MRFQSGGAVKKENFYVVRSADSELPEALLAGEFCYLLAPRQIGKSSLRVRAAERLTSRGVRCVTIDLQQIGSKEVTIDAWFFGLIEDTVHGLGLKCDPVEFWRSHELLTWPQRWSVFLREEVLKNVQEPTVIFVDEIDSVRSLPFSADDFFATIRSAHEARADNKNYERLTFCLMGVAAPGDLIQDVTRTPFNIGRPVHLQDFTWEEAKQFLSNLTELEGDPERLLRAVFGWTDGHPYMMQKLCEGLSKQRGMAGTSEEERVENLVRNLFLVRGRAADSNLRYAEDRFDNAYRAAAKSQMLQLYRQLLSGEAVPVEVSSPVQAELKLTGLIAECQDGGKPYLKPRNRIFSSVYNLKWINEKESNRLFHEALTNWQEAIGRGESGDDYLLRGQALEEGLAWAESRDDISKEEREYLMAGLELARGEAETKTAARNRYVRRLKFLAAGLALMMLLASGFAIFAFTQSAQLQKSLKTIAEKNKEITQQAQDLKEQNKAIIQQARIVEAQNKEITQQAQIVEEQNDALSVQRAAAEKGRVEAEVQRVVAIAARNEAMAAASEARTQSEAAKAEQNVSRRLLYASTINLAQQNYESGNLERTRDLLNTPSLEDLRGFEWRHLSSLMADYKTLTTRAESPFRKVALSPAGRVIAVSGDDGVVSLWDAVSGAPLGDLGREEGMVSALAFSRDGRTLAVGDLGSVTLWDVAGRRQVTTLNVEAKIVSPDGSQRQYSISSLAFSPDGRTLAAGSSDDGTVWLWEAGSWAKRAPLIDAEARSILTLAFSPDGKTLATGSFGFVKLWDLVSYAPVSTLISDLSTSPTVSPDGSRRQYGVSTLAFSPDGRTLAAGSGADGIIRVWPAQSSVSREPTTRFAHAGGILSLAFSSDGRMLATGGSDKVVKLWSAESYQEVESFRDFKSVVTSVSFWDKGDTLATGTSDGTIKLWGLKSRRAPLSFTETSFDIGALAFSPDGQTLATGRTDGAVRLWEVVEGERFELLKLQPPQLGSAMITALAFTPDGRTLATGNSLGDVRLFSNTGEGWRRDAVGVLEGGGVLTLAFSPDGRMLAVSRKDETVWLWDVDSRDSSPPIKALNGYFRVLAFSPDGQTLAAVRSDGTIWLYDLKSRQTIELSAGNYPTAVLSLAFSPDGRTLAAGSIDGDVSLFEKTGVGWVLDSETLRGSPDGISALAFSLDGLTLATGGNDGVVKLWSAQSHRELMTLNGQTDGIVTLTFTLDSKSLLAAGRRGAVNLWRA